MNSLPARDVIEGYESLCASGGSAVVERDVISVVGPEAARYLQGQLSQDVVAMASDNAWSFLLGPNGKVDAWLRVHRCDPESYLIEVDAGWGEQVCVRLSRFLLRTKASIEGSHRRKLLQRRWDPQLLRIGFEAPEGALIAVPVGPNVTGIDVLYANDNDAVAEASGDVVPQAALDRYRIAHGVPSMGSELTDATIPGEAGQWVIDASVSFTKGCYTGQELVARIDSRGNNVPHPIRLLALGAQAVVGDDVVLDGTVVGQLTSTTPALGPELPALALARVGRSVTLDAELSVGSRSEFVAASVVEPGTTR
ncbi:MAG: hypothetical protein WEA11_07165 [Acidimicrobiales bacterium]